MLKITKKQKEKLETIQAYLKTDIGQGSAIIGDNDVTDVYSLQTIYANATGIWLKGSACYGGQIKDRIYFDQIGRIYSAMRRGDGDFKIFINN